MAFVVGYQHQFRSRFADGRVTQTQLPELYSELSYDAAGRLAFKYDKRLLAVHEDKNTMYFDGDGRMLKRVTDQCRILQTIPPDPPSEECEWRGEGASYYVRSTVLGGEIIGETGIDATNPLHRYVFAGGAKFAELSYRWDSSVRYDTVQFYHIDAAGVSQRVTRNSPEALLGTSAMYPNYIDPRHAEYDSGGTNVGLVTNYVQQPAPPSDPTVPVDGDAYIFQDGQWGPVLLDGLPISRQALMMMGIGGALGIQPYNSRGVLIRDAQLLVESVNGNLYFYSRVAREPSKDPGFYLPSITTDTSSISSWDVSWSYAKASIGKKDGIVEDNPNCIQNILRSRNGSKVDTKIGNAIKAGGTGTFSPPYGTDTTRNSHDGIHVLAGPGDYVAIALGAMQGTVLHYGPQVSTRSYNADVYGPQRSNLDIQLAATVKGDPLVLTLKDLEYRPGMFTPGTRIRTGAKLGNLTVNLGDSSEGSTLHVTLMTLSTYNSYIHGRVSSGSRASVPYYKLMDAANDPNSPFRCP